MKTLEIVSSRIVVIGRNIWIGSNESVSGEPKNDV
jgi:hypothetical protein